MNLFLADYKKYKSRGVDLLPKIVLRYSEHSPTEAIPIPEYWESKIMETPNKLDNYRSFILSCSFAFDFDKINKYDYLFNPSDNRAKFKNHWALYCRSLLSLPDFFDTKNQMEFFAEKIEKNLDILLKEIENYPPCDELTLLLIHAPFYRIATRINNNIQIKRKYGELIYRCYYKYLSQFENEKEEKKHSKLKIGFVLDAFNVSSCNYFFLEFLNLDKNKFDVYSYALDSDKLHDNEDYEIFQKTKDYSKEIRIVKEETDIKKIETMAKKIIDDGLDALIFVQNSHITRTLGSFRLVKKQCFSYENPYTTGLKNIDYFLSGEVIETDKSDNHYTEKLVKLPKSGFFAKKTRPLITEKKRSDFKLSEEKTVYLNCQFLDKYSPQYDYIFPRIAKKVRDAVFIFIKGMPKDGDIHWEKFVKRLRKAFDNEGIKFEDYVFLINQKMPYDDYLNFINFSDIFLDTFDWSGGVTSLEAFSYGLPIVTMPTELMRSRQTFGMYKNMGIFDLVAKNVDEYIDLAVKLGLDEDFRLKMKEKILEKNHVLFEDRDVIRGLENFLIETNNSNLKSIT